ncbi:MAG: DUF1269 domain-containing protein [Chloroflexi bacterium]|nr:DUF1269 domain-containing protein [Chloroflexota bacterium]MBV9601569.1 DUF1269 domain-containing protein [Chloroflexota bacterium]
METATSPHVGPVQLVVIGFPPEAQFRGEIMRAFSEVRGRGVIRVIDALFVRKDDEGRITASIRDSDLSIHEREALGAVAGGLLGLMAGGDEESEALGATLAAQAIANDAFGLGIGDLQNVKDSIPPGNAALVLLVEHQWALDLKVAMRNAGGVPIVQGFLTPEALLMVGAEMRAVVEAENTIALAHAVEGAAVLSALATVEAAERIQEAAVAETARVLIAAGLIEEAAAQDVIDTLAAADLIKQEALAEARAAVAQANADQAATNGKALEPAAASADGA